MNNCGVAEISPLNCGFLHLLYVRRRSFTVALASETSYWSNSVTAMWLSSSDSDQRSMRYFNISVLGT